MRILMVTLQREQDVVFTRQRARQIAQVLGFDTQDQTRIATAVSEIARVLKMHGDFVCQTTLGPRKPPLWIRLADRMLKFGYFYLDDLKERLYRFNFDLKTEERSNINYIFRAAKSG